jgi:hypothetical protein
MEGMKANRPTIKKLSDTHSANKCYLVRERRVGSDGGAGLGSGEVIGVMPFILPLLLLLLFNAVAIGDQHICNNGGLGRAYINMF